MKEKTYVEDVSRSIYDIRNEEKDMYKVSRGLTADIVEQISREKHDPEWMRRFRLESLQIYHETPMTDWGPSIEGLNMDEIVTYVRSNTPMKGKWTEVPDDIKNTFEALGIPEAERKSLAGVGAQYDSELVYHNVREEVAAQGVVYTDMESALTGEYAELVKKHFMKLVPPKDHKFAALHGAVWSGGSFVYVPAGVQVEIPLQSYFRLNAPGAGQFEHTLIIVEEGASLHFIEGCSAPKYNVANLHAGCVELFVEEGAKLRYSTIENWSKKYVQLKYKAGKGRSGRHDRMGVGLLWLPCILSVSHKPSGRRGRKVRVYGHYFCRRGAESGHRREGDPQCAEHLFLYEYPLHFKGRRHEHLPQQRCGDEAGKAQQKRGFLRVPDAGRHFPFGYDPGDGRAHKGCRHRA